MTLMILFAAYALAVISALAFVTNLTRCVKFLLLSRNVELTVEQQKLFGVTDYGLCHYCVLGRWAKYRDQCVCVSIFHQIFCGCYMWPCLGLVTTTEQFTMYFLFCGNVSHNEAIGLKSSTRLCFMEFARWQHLGWSLMSVIAMCNSYSEFFYQHMFYLTLIG